jgi:uncharacterized Zn-finger protein
MDDAAVPCCSDTFHLVFLTHMEHYIALYAYYRMTDVTLPAQYKLGKHRSNAMELVNKVPIIEVDGEMAVCDGGGGGLGHPNEYISLARPGSVNACKYCSLRFTQKAH